MRDPNRIDIILTQLGELWKQLPDWRLMQLIVNLQYWVGSDMFYYEDERFIEELKQFIEGEKQ